MDSTVEKGDEYNHLRKLLVCAGIIQISFLAQNINNTW